MSTHAGFPPSVTAPSGLPSNCRRDTCDGKGGCQRHPAGDNVDKQGPWAMTAQGFYGRYLRAFAHLAALPATFDLITDEAGVSQVVTSLRDAAANSAGPTGRRIRRRLLLPWSGERKTEIISVPPMTKPLRNFLIIAGTAPSGDTELDPHAKLIQALAHHLMEDGYVYVLRPQQSEAADDQAGVRYLPLRPRLPSFGLMTAVVVVGDPAWSRAAAEAYPEAQLFTFELGTSLTAADVQPAVLAWAVAQKRLC